MNQYEEMKKKLMRGWNTWNTRSVLSHVLLPEGFALNLAIKEFAESNYLKEALIGRIGSEDGQDEVVFPGPHAYDGSYTELKLLWKGIEIIVQTAANDGELVILVTPLKTQKKPPVLVVESGLLWNRPGSISLEENTIFARFPERCIQTYITGEMVYEPNIPVQAPYLAVNLNETIGISAGKKRGLDEIKRIIENNKKEHLKQKEKYGELSEAYNALQSCMAWDTIYEPKKDRVVSTVSRRWNTYKGGYVLFCWDSYFGAYLASVDNKELAYSNAIEITREKTPGGFIPNCTQDTGFVSLDRSQPPVGAMVIRELYRKYKDKWLLEEVFDVLLEWNRWYFENRHVKEGVMAWGSNPFEPQVGNPWEGHGVNDTYGGALESGLDNSPMYDGIAFDKDRHVMKLGDVGLTGLYIMDCNALTEMAQVLQREAEAAELKARSEKCSQGMKWLWNETSGIHMNRHTDSGDFNGRISPTNFYALFSDCVTQAQAERIIGEHFFNPDEFWGEWMLPSIARNDPAYAEQDYWRGRIWAPLNFLVYIALRRFQLSEVQKALAEKSVKLILKEWLSHGHVHENYCADTGEGCNRSNSDRFYHWGALLSLIALIDAGFVEGPEKSII